MDRVTIPEGLTIAETARIIQARIGIDSTTFVGLASDSVVAHELGVEANTLEGYLFPATYHFHLGIVGGRDPEDHNGSFSKHTHGGVPGPGGRTGIQCSRDRHAGFHYRAGSAGRRRKGYDFGGLSQPAQKGYAPASRSHGAVRPWQAEYEATRKTPRASIALQYVRARGIASRTDLAAPGRHQCMPRCIQGKYPTSSS